MYLRFAARLGAGGSIPGKDEAWNPYVLWRYMLWRSETCKPSTVYGCLSALSHFGWFHRHVLPTKRWDGDPLLHRDIQRMKKEIAIRFVSRHGVDGTAPDVKRTTPLGTDSVALLLSAFEAYSRRNFLRLKRRHRHHLVGCVLQHTCGMRFGHFSRRYRMSAFVLGADGAYRLITDWHRYSGQRRYCLVFATAPRWDCLQYSLRRADGTVYATVTAAQLLSWHFSQLRQAGESVVFAPVKGTVPSRLQRQE